MYKFVKYTKIEGSTKVSFNHILLCGISGQHKDCIDVWIYINHKNGLV